MVWFDWCVLNHILPFDSNHSKFFIVFSFSLRETTATSCCPFLMQMAASTSSTGTVRWFRSRWRPLVSSLVLEHSSRAFELEVLLKVTAARATTASGFMMWSSKEGNDQRVDGGCHSKLGVSYLTYLVLYRGPLSFSPVFHSASIGFYCIACKLESWRWIYAYLYFSSFLSKKTPKESMGNSSMSLLEVFSNCFSVCMLCCNGAKRHISSSWRRWVECPG